MKTIKTLLILLFLFQLTNVSAQEDYEFTIGTELRPRTEYDHGYGFPAPKYTIQDEYINKGTLYTTQRTRLKLDFKNDLIHTKLVLQDVRAWGYQAQLNANEDFAASVHEAWAELVLTKDISFKAGRTELVYDDQRIFGNEDWLQQARSHDLALLTYKGPVEIHAGLAFNGFPYEGLNDYKSMQFFWMKAKSGDLTYSLLALNKGVRERGYWYGTLAEEKNVYAQVLGTRINFEKGYWNFFFNGYYQTGKKAADWLDLNSLPEDETIYDYNTLNNTDYVEGPGLGQKIAAFTVSGEVIYDLSDYIDVKIAYEYLSGNDFTNLNRSKENAFRPLYGSNHNFNGWMDYFYFDNHIGSVGLQDIQMNIEFQYENAYIKLHPHYFLPASKGEYIDESGELVRYSAFGTEIDFMAGYKMIKEVASIEIGYSHFLPTEDLLALKNGGIFSGNDNFGMNNWAWIMLKIEPQWTLEK